MKLISEKAKEELKEILFSQIGVEKMNLLNDEDIESLGMFLLTLLAEATKRRSSS